MLIWRNIVLLFTYLFIYYVYQNHLTDNHSNDPSRPSFTILYIVKEGFRGVCIIFLLFFLFLIFALKHRLWDIVIYVLSKILKKHTEMCQVYRSKHRGFIAYRHVNVINVMKNKNV